MHNYHERSHKFNVERVRVSHCTANGGVVCWDLHDEPGMERCLNVYAADTYLMPGTHLMNNEVPKCAKVAPIKSTQATHSNIAFALEEEIQKGESHADQLRVANICFLLSTLESMADSSNKWFIKESDLDKKTDKLLFWEVPEITTALRKLRPAWQARRRADPTAWRTMVSDDQPQDLV